MDLSSFVDFRPDNLDHLRVIDYDGQLEELPDDFFEPYAMVSKVYVVAKKLTKIPASLSKLSRLKVLHIGFTKLKQLPEELFSLPLEDLRVEDNNLIDFDREAERLCGLTSLKELTLGGYKGKVFPQKLNLVKTLEVLVLPNAKKNDESIPEIIALMGQLPKLRIANLTFSYKRFPGLEFFREENMAMLDRLENLNGWGWGYKTEKELPLTLGLLEKVKVDIGVGRTTAEFQQEVAGQGYSSWQRQLLFGLWVKNIAALNEFLPTKLAEKIVSSKVTFREAVEDIAKGLADGEFEFSDKD